MLSRILAGLVVVVAFTSALQSQQLGNADLKKDMDNAVNYKDRNELIDGKLQPQAKHQKLMDIMSRWYVYRVTWPDMLNNPKKMEDVQKEFDNELVGRSLSQFAQKTNKAFVEQMGIHLAKSFKDVLNLKFEDNRQSAINAALMLPPAARLKQDDLADYLVELARDPKKHDAVKVYAVKALGEFFPAKMLDDNSSEDPESAPVKKKQARDMDRIKVLSEYIHRKWPPSTDEGEIDAIRYLRREAIASLGQVGVPAVANLKKRGVVEGPAAYELLKVLVRTGKDAFEPPTGLSERIEAAIGLCHLKNPTVAGYDPSVSVYAVAICFLEYAEEYSRDYPNLKDRKDPALKLISPTSKVPTMPFRIQTERFRHGMKDLLANSQGTPAVAAAKKLEPNLMKLANDMAKYQPVQNDLPVFRNVVASLAPKTGTLYTRGKGPDFDPKTLVPPVAAPKDDDGK